LIRLAAPRTERILGFSLSVRGRALRARRVTAPVLGAGMPGSDRGCGRGRIIGLTTATGTEGQQRPQNPIAGVRRRLSHDGSQALHEVLPPIVTARLKRERPACGRSGDVRETVQPTGRRPSCSMVRLMGDLSSWFETGSRSRLPKRTPRPNASDEEGWTVV